MPEMFAKRGVQVSLHTLRSSAHPRYATFHNAAEPCRGGVPGDICTRVKGADTGFATLHQTLPLFVAPWPAKHTRANVT